MSIATQALVYSVLFLSVCAHHHEHRSRWMHLLDPIRAVQGAAARLTYPITSTLNNLVGKFVLPPPRSLPPPPFYYHTEDNRPAYRPVQDFNGSERNLLVKLLKLLSQQNGIPNISHEQATDELNSDEIASEENYYDSENIEDLKFRHAGDSSETNTDITKFDSPASTTDDNAVIPESAMETIGDNHDDNEMESSILSYSVLPQVEDVATISDNGMPHGQSNQYDVRSFWNLDDQGSVRTHHHTPHAGTRPHYGGEYNSPNLLNYPFITPSNPGFFPSNIVHPNLRPKMYDYLYYNIDSGNNQELKSTGNAFPTMSSYEYYYPTINANTPFGTLPANGPSEWNTLITFVPANGPSDVNAPVSYVVSDGAPGLYAPTNYLPANGPSGVSFIPNHPLASPRLNTPVNFVPINGPSGPIGYVPDDLPLGVIPPRDSLFVPDMTTPSQSSTTKSGIDASGK